ncbi:MAG: hypothetical protein J6K50_05285 [Clostridia bacterium]|nr:hypothetical protein [Clostridia bacterium]
MRNILTHLYYGDINESGRSTKELQKTEDFKNSEERYEKFMATLNEKQKELFEDFYRYEINYISLEKEQVYANGIKTGMCLILELMDFDPSA